MRGGIKGCLEFFRKFIRFGGLADVHFDNIFQLLTFDLYNFNENHDDIRLSDPE